MVSEPRVSQSRIESYTAYGATDPAAVPPVRDVDEATIALRDAVSGLEAIVGELLTRLKPIVNDQPRPASNGKDHAALVAGKCDLSRAINEQRSRVGALANAINEALGELQV